jgi:hypothetical protein
MWGGSESHYIKGAGGKKIFSPVLKVPRQCSLVLPAEVRFKEGEGLGRQNIKF